MGGPTQCTVIRCTRQVQLAKLDETRLIDSDIVLLINDVISMNSPTSMRNLPVQNLPGRLLGCAYEQDPGLYRYTEEQFRYKLLSDTLHASGAFRLPAETGPTKDGASSIPEHV